MPPKSDIPLVVLEQAARIFADSVIKGLTTAPALDTSPKCPCVVLLFPEFDGFLMTIEEISQERGETLAATLRSNYGDVLDACASFANSIWTDEETSKYENCECGRHDMFDTREGYAQIKEIRGPGRRPLQEDIFQVFLVLNDMALDIQSTSLNTIKLEKKGGKRSKWPSSPSKFIPRGPSTAASAFVRWAKLAASIAPIDTLFRLTHYCPSLTAAMAEEKALLPVIGDVFSQLVNTIREVGPRNMNEGHLKFLKEELSRFRSIFGSVWLQNRLCAPGGEFGANNIQALIPIYHAICDLMPLLSAFGFSDSQHADITRVFVSIGVGIYGCSCLTRSPLPLHSCFAPFILNAKEQDTNSSFGKLIYSTLDLQNQRKCTEVSCTQTGEEARINLKVCGGCKVVRYCSKECQLSDWRVHKNACKPLKVLLSMPERSGTLNMAPAQMKEAGPRVLDQKLRELSGLTEEGIKTAEGYINAHSLAVRATNNSQESESTGRPNFLVMEALNAMSTRSSAP